MSFFALNLKTFSAIISGSYFLPILSRSPSSVPRPIDKQRRQKLLTFTRLSQRWRASISDKI